MASVPHAPAFALVAPSRSVSREDHIAQATSQNRQIRDHDSFLGTGDDLSRSFGSPGKRGSVAKSGKQPAVVDPPEAQTAFEQDGAAFPMGGRGLSVRPTGWRARSCTLCFNTCSVKFHFAGDKLVKITGNEEDPILQGRVCPKSQHTLQMYHNERRLTQPLKRIGARGEAEVRGNQLGASTRRNRRQVGAAAAERARSAWHLRWHAHGHDHHPRLYPDVRTNAGDPNLETTDPFCAAGKNITYQMTQGANGCGNSYMDEDIGSAGMYLYIGDNQAETRPVYFGMVNNWRVKNGTKMVVVDPRFSATASKADRWHGIRPRHGHGARLWPLSQHTFAQHPHDQRYGENWVEGWERWRDFLNEQGYTPQWAAGITDIAADDIRRLAEEIGEVGRLRGLLQPWH